MIAADGLPQTGALSGLAFLSGEAFHVDPIGWTLPGAAGVTNPNVVIFGAPGHGGQPPPDILPVLNGRDST